MTDLLNFGRMLASHARLAPTRIGARDLDRDMTFAVWNARACRLANALLGLGLAKGDRVAVLAYNCLEWVEIYAATAKAGLVAVPINFRLVGREVAFIVENCEAAAIIVQDELAGVVEEARPQMTLRADRYIHFGRHAAPAGYRDYEDLLGRASDGETDQLVLEEDPWTLMYTSGTTGNPKGAIRSHRGGALLSLVTEIELGIHRNDGALLVMPMCHINSLYFFGAFAYAEATINICSRQTFDPEHCVRTLAESGASFTSLVPTHYVLMLGLFEAVRARYRLDSITKLMISSAPARQDTKRAVMEMFPNSGLFELYGATETGWVTMLHPHEQFSKLGSVGRECVGSGPIRLLDEDGYIQPVDRKTNMIISGGENVYPSEVGAMIGAHPLVKDVAVIGVPDAKWCERVHAVVVPVDGAALTEASLTEWAKSRVAGYKRPRSFDFVRHEDIPRNATGKVLYRELKARLVRERA
ncbi:AMP-binding protein [Xanthobacter oligotrophicus]|uniref:AMP-binding protein n=1 Tax=Xanthobacter oligotrophicus TaxID=2607286 RepID=A0ABW7A1Q1_9HYPH